MFIAPAVAHDIYDGLKAPDGVNFCCGGRDCHPAESVYEAPGGYFADGIFVPHWRVQSSPDERFHICVSNNRLVCFFAPVPTQ